MIRTVPLVACLLLFPCAWAEEPIKCNDAGNMLEMSACAEDALNAADAELNATYQALLKAGAQEPTFIARLRAAQRAWIQFRDADVDAKFACEKNDERLCWGSMLSLKRPAYRTQLTHERTAQLAKLLATRYPARPAD